MIPLLETTRLRLRRIVSTDAPAIFAYASQPHITRNLSWPAHRNMADTLAYIQMTESKWIDGIAFGWGIETLEGNEFLGTIGVSPQGARATIGYVLRPEAWGQGFATEATQALIDYLFSLPYYHRIEAICFTDNPASARVLEKSGMAREGLLRKYAVAPDRGPLPEDVYMYAVVRT